MSDYRRWYVPGGMFFFTVVTYNRRPILTTDAGRKHLRNAIKTVRKDRPFEIFAIALLHDHFHLIMKLPQHDVDYSTRMKRIKEEFTKSWLADGLPEAPVTPAQLKKGERGVWQPRFWEHAIEDYLDLENHTHYIHWNPRKHRLVSRVRDWPWSSFFRFVKAGDYDINWGGTDPNSLQLNNDWGE